jgi:hypothetical protein
VLVERPHIVDWRCRYLRAIRWKSSNNIYRWVLDR